MSHVKQSFAGPYATYFYRVADRCAQQQLNTATPGGGNTSESTSDKQQNHYVRRLRTLECPPKNVFHCNRKRIRIRRRRRTDFCLLYLASSLLNISA